MIRHSFRESSESGSALIQVLAISAILGVTAYVYMQFTAQNDKNATRWIQRTTNLNMGANLAAYVNDRQQLYEISVTPTKDAAAVDLTYP